jgi:hypothetical protein
MLWLKSTEVQTFPISGEPYETAQKDEGCFEGVRLYIRYLDSSRVRVPLLQEAERLKPSSDPLHSPYDRALVLLMLSDGILFLYKH